MLVLSMFHRHRNIMKKEMHYETFCLGTDCRISRSLYHY